jgi:NosR/NirI family nitrous oxide reductase transcriptional regulator
MKKNIRAAVLVMVTFLIAFNLFAVQRFPRPEFESGYKQPITQLLAPRSVFFEYLDLAVFIGCLSLITWLVLKKRSRKGVFWLSIFSLLYFGFYRKGCICPVGSLQNVTLALFNPEYSIPINGIAFFILPLAYTLFFGRTFCAGVCPLGAIQDVFALRPVTLKSWAQSLLGLIPFIYLGLAVLFAATGSDFIVCRYDPFVGFFRHNATFMMFAIGGILLLIGVFIARPYCRFLCPYGVLLNLVSRFSKNHLSIAPSACISCRLCENACPFGAIDKPTGAKYKEHSNVLVKRLILYCIITPLLMAACGWTASKYHETFAKVNGKVRLANQVRLSSISESAQPSIEITTFRSSGKPAEQLYAEASVILDRFYLGSWFLGAFIGLVFGLTLARLTLIPYKTDYTTNKGTCFSCARCVDYCPVKE